MHWGCGRGRKRTEQWEGGGDSLRRAGGREGCEAEDESNDSWVEVEEMRLHKQEGIQVMRKVAGKLGNERFRSRGEEGMCSRHSS